MEAYDMSKSDLGEKLGKGPCSSQLPSLARVLAAITALVLIVTPCMYSLAFLQAQISLVGELRTELHSLRQRVDQLEALHTSQISRNKEQEDKMRQFLLGSTDPESETENVKWNEDSKPSVDLLEKLFRDLDLGSGPEVDAGVQNTKPFELGPENAERGSVRVQDETEPIRDNSDEIPILHHGDKLLTNHMRDRDDVSWETTNRKPAIGQPRPRRQAENRESRNRNRERNRERNRDRKASKGSSKRNRGNRGSTGTREQEQLNGGADPPPHQPQAAYIHFVGNVSSRVNTDPERTHPLSPRMVNISATLLSDWAYARWTTHRQKSKFGFNSGVVTVKEPGTYFVYSQVQFFDDERYTGHVITINERETFKCAEGTPEHTTSPRNMKTCYVGGLAYLHRESRVAVRVAFPNRWVNMHHDSAYFGMFKVS